MLALLAPLTCAVPARAIINPNFTPVDLAVQSDVILRVQVGPPDEKGKLQATVLRELKGKAPAALALTLDMVDERVAKDFRRALDGRRGMDALLFAGDFSAAGKGDAADSEAKPVGALHVDTSRLGHLDAAWFALLPKGERGFQVAADGLELHAVWAGSDEMLERAVRHILADPRADVPVSAGVRWGGEATGGRLAGKVHDCLAIDDGGAAGARLLVGCEAGDRLFACRQAGGARALADVTAAAKLATKSRCAAWGDFDGDGHGDVASWDGRALTLALGRPDGTFACKPVAAALPADTAALACLDAGGPRAALLASAQGPPRLVVFAADGTCTLRAVAGEAGWPGAALGAAGPCAAADFDADGLPDILQPLEKGALLYRGTASGRFAAPATACAGRLTRSPAACAAGDFDADGQLDAVVAGADGCVLLTSLGGGRFAESAQEAGEVPYKVRPGMVGVAPCDINNDGRQDAAMFYAQVGPQVFFNRGFRCFGFGIELDLAQRPDLKCAEPLLRGQQAGAAADFNGDGAQDIAAVAPDGGVWLLLRQPVASRMSLTVALPGGCHGPLTVTARDGKRNCGARVARAGTPAAFGKIGKGPLTLTWTPPGGKPQTLQIVITADKRVELPAAVR